jgi:hypothetical protein
LILKCESLISPETIQAYRETEFRVFVDDVVVLKISQKNEELVDLLKSHRSEACAFVTAFNPLGELLSHEQNSGLQKRLEEEIQFRGLTYIAGEGKHPVGDWPGEPSYLVFDLSLEAAKTLGRKFNQNAIVWCGPDAVPQLIFLR